MSRRYRRQAHEDNPASKLEIVILLAGIIVALLVAATGVPITGLPY